MRPRVFASSSAAKRGEIVWRNYAPNRGGEAFTKELCRK